MNKTISEATKEEIRQAYESGSVAQVKHRRKTEKIELYNDFTGCLDLVDTYTFEKAISENNGLAWRLSQAERKRRSRIYKKIERMTENQGAIFLTLTFNDTTLLNNKVESLYKHVKEFLKAQCSQYIANVDFGSKNGRIHFHAVVVPKDNVINGDTWRHYGAINFERIHTSKKSTIRTGRYINKLTNHSLKDNGYYKRLIFSRNTEKAALYS